MTATLVAHAGGNHATYAEVCSVPIPQYTRTHRPVTYQAAIEQVIDNLERWYGPVEARFALAHNGSQLFATFAVKVDSDLHAMAIGMRQSYDKSLAFGLVAGSSVFVCDNLAFNGEIRQIRKNTTYSAYDVSRLIASIVDVAHDAYSQIDSDYGRWCQIAVPQREAFAQLGTMRGQGLLTARQFEVALGDVQKPRHAEFAEPTAFSLFNAVTEGLKKGSAGEMAERTLNATRYFQGVYNA